MPDLFRITFLFPFLKHLAFPLPFHSKRHFFLHSFSIQKKTFSSLGSFPFVKNLCIPITETSSFALSFSFLEYLPLPFQLSQKIIHISKTFSFTTIIFIPVIFPFTVLSIPEKKFFRDSYSKSILLLHRHSHSKKK